ncbi:MAG: MerR family transcriptional regulator [bacterium]|nr:MerR family transcriptional regulator [bacterium]
MLLIGEVSKISQVSLRMLRYYDKAGIFKPKVIHEENGYRYYTADQLDDLYKIVELRDLGFSVAEIGTLMGEDNKGKYLDAIGKKKRELEAEVSEIQTKLKRLSTLETDVNTNEEEILRKDVTIVLKSIPNKDVISYRKTVENYFCEEMMWGEFGKLLADCEVSFSNECFSLYHDIDYREENVDIEICLVLDHPLNRIPEGLIHRQVIGCDKAVSIIVKGPYENISYAYRKFAHWLEAHEEYHMTGPTRQICYVSPVNTDHPEEYVTEILIPLSGS